MEEKRRRSRSEQRAKKSPLQKAGKKYWKQCEQCRTE